jgi:uncharacterized protein YbjT (DUF2867 family)
MKVAIAGASGFVGRALVTRLAGRHEVIALSRGVPTGDPPAHVRWRGCDLFNLRDAERGLEGADVAVYLVHSMLPKARLTQAKFDDLDLICADNFARAAAARGVQRIVYLGGLLPRDAAPLSRHLASRHEVERALAAHGVPVTTLRAGLIIGAGGSSFEMMSRLVQRLPFMVAPRWTRHRCQPIALDDVLPLLERAVEEPALAGRAWDVGGPDVVTYGDILRTTGRVLGKPVRLLTLPMRTANLSLLWVSAVTGTPQALVRPLVESLDHDMLVTDGAALQKGTGASVGVEKAIARAFDVERSKASGVATKAPVVRAVAARTVCSIQRLPMGRQRTARWVAEEYLRWLPRLPGRLIDVRVGADGVCRFFSWPLRKPLLELTLSPDRSTPDRQLFYVTGGLLAGRAQTHPPRLEFRTALDGTVVLAALLDFVPRLPWLIYRLTQGPFHLMVMRAFGRHLASAKAPP